MLVDTHAHLDDLKYEEDRQEVIARAKAEGTTRIITMGDTMESSFNAIKIADNFDGVFAGAGVHPQEALSIQSSKDYDTLAELMTLPKVKVLGEIGLDYYYENAPREVQREVDIRDREHAPEAFDHVTPAAVQRIPFKILCIREPPVGCPQRQRRIEAERIDEPPAFPVGALV